MASRQASAKTLAKLRRICLAMPEAEEIETWGHPTFRVRKKIFVGCGVGEDDRPQMTCKAPRGEQQALIASNPERFFVPAYVGSKGWVGIYLDGAVGWAEITELVEESYRMTAPKRLI